MPMFAETIMKSSKVSRAIISISVVAIVGLLTYNWAVSPQASYLHAAQQYETLSIDIEKKVKIISNSIRIKNIKIEKLRAGINFSNVSFFSAEQAADFFAQLEKISTAASCDLKSVILEKETIISVEKNKLEAAASVLEKRAYIKIDGSYGAIIDFTEALKEYPLTICISDLKLESRVTGSDKLSCSMNLKVYLTEDKELLSDE